MNHKPLQFRNLRALLPTPESRIELSIFTGIPIAKINNWLNQNNESEPEADNLVILSKYFDCTVDYLLDMSNIKDRPNDVKRLIEELHKNDI